MKDFSFQLFSARNYPPLDDILATQQGLAAGVPA